jgi:hypothetical protein
VSSSDGVLLIDLDDTLIDRQAGFRLWATTFLRGLSRDTPDELAWVVELDGTLTSREELFGGIKDRYGFPDDVPAMMDAYYEVFPRLIPQPRPRSGRVWRSNHGCSAASNGRSAGCTSRSRIET